MEEVRSLENYLVNYINSVEADMKTNGFYVNIVDIEIMNLAKSILMGMVQPDNMLDRIGSISTNTALTPRHVQVCNIIRDLIVARMNEVIHNVTPM